MARRLRVAVVFGGRSGEHEVSLTSARAIMGALEAQPGKYEVVPVGITKEGHWLAGADPLRALLAASSEGPPLLAAVAQEAAVAADPGAGGLLLVPRQRDALTAPNAPAGGIDVVFPVLHGPFGEDGTVQGMLELAGVPYVGAGVLASALGMDKVAMKAAFQQAGLPVLDYLPVLRRDWQQRPAEVEDAIERRFGYPCFVKPANLGSSVGISKVHDRAELGPALAEAGRYDRKLLAEQAAIDCREIECSVLGNDDPIASVPGEVVPCREFYDYRAKYIEEGSELIIPASLPAATVARVRALAVGAFTAIDCAGMARVDFFVSRDGSQVWVNEINTIPGFTPISMYPKLWEASGIPFAALVDRLVHLALERHAERTGAGTG
jgi:D-alanine-D-alanine ligase